MNAWIFLALAICIEIAATTFLKLSDGFARWQWGIASMACYTMCFWLLAPALKVLPVGVVYAMWAGVGIVGATVIGVYLFQERLAAVQYACIAMIALGAVGLRLSTQA